MRGIRRLRRENCWMKQSEKWNFIVVSNVARVYRLFLIIFCDVAFTTCNFWNCCRLKKLDCGRFWTRNAFFFTGEYVNYDNDKKKKKWNTFRINSLLDLLYNMVNYRFSICLFVFLNDVIGQMNRDPENIQKLFSFPLKFPIKYSEVWQTYSGLRYARLYIHKVRNRMTTAVRKYANTVCECYQNVQINSAVQIFFLARCGDSFRMYQF